MFPNLGDMLPLWSGETQDRKGVDSCRIFGGEPKTGSLPSERELYGVASPCIDHGPVDAGEVVDFVPLVAEVDVGPADARSHDAHQESSSRGASIFRGSISKGPPLRRKAAA